MSLLVHEIQFFKSDYQKSNRLIEKLELSGKAAKSPRYVTALHVRQLIEHLNIWIQLNKSPHLCPPEVEKILKKRLLSQIDGSKQKAFLLKKLNRKKDFATKDILSIKYTVEDLTPTLKTLCELLNRSYVGSTRVISSKSKLDCFMIPKNYYLELNFNDWESLDMTTYDWSDEEVDNGEV